MRLVSLLPSATEIVYALGLGDDLVGVTFECDEPPSARADKTVVVGGRDTRGMTAGRDRRATSGPSSPPARTCTRCTPARSPGCDPDLILTQDLCRVCALPSGQVEDALDHLGCRADVLSLDPHSLDEVLGTILAVGERAGVPDRAAALVAGLRAAAGRGRRGGCRRAAAAAGRGGGVGRPAVHRRALDARPGHARPAASRWPRTRARRRSQTTLGRDRRGGTRTWSSSRRAASTCDGAVEQAAAGGPRAARRAEVWAIDADGIVVRPGPRLVDGVEALAAILHPDAVPAAPPAAVQRVTAPG